MRTLTRWENRWAVAAFGGFYPANAHERLRTGIEEMDIEGYLVDFRSRVRWKAAIGLRLALWIVALAPIIVLKRPRSIAGISSEERTRVLSALLASPVYAVRQLTMLLKAIAAILYAKAPAVRSVMMPSEASVPSSGPQLVPLGKKEVGHDRSVA